jgi:glutaminyl-peptide cyclotransferase
MHARLVSLVILTYSAVSWAQTKGPPTAVSIDGYQIVHTYPHDPAAFTQGLVYTDGHLYESTGLNGKSSVRLVDLETGKTLQHHDLPAEYFGEGLTVWNNRLVQLTWKSKTGFVYDVFSFAIEKTFHYDTEGWGLTHDNHSLILSDGTSFLRFLDPQTFRETRRIEVWDESGRVVGNLNELEYIQGEIYANVWQTDRIARISPKTGRVLAWIDLTGLIDKRVLPNPDAVLNGIAYDSKSNRIFVTGKLWPKLFEIKVVRERGSDNDPHVKTSDRSTKIVAPFRIFDQVSN